MRTYVIKKYVKAKSAIDAIQKEKKCEVDDVYVYEYNENEIGFKTTSNAIGFEVDDKSFEYEIIENKKKKHSY